VRPILQANENESGQKKLMNVPEEVAKLKSIMRAKASNNEHDKRRQAETEFVKVIENVCSGGFYGTASVTVNIQDGHIQFTRVVVDRMVK